MVNLVATTPASFTLAVRTYILSILSKQYFNNVIFDFEFSKFNEGVVK
jgi:hypothetical protein